LHLSPLPSFPSRDALSFFTPPLFYDLAHFLAEPLPRPLYRPSPPSYPFSSLCTQPLNIWQDDIAIWQLSPYLGVGAGNFQFFDLAYGTDIAGVAHNQFLEVLAEMAVQGLICLLLIIIMWGRIALEHLNTAISPTGKAIVLAYPGYFAALLFATFFTSPFIPTADVGGGTAPCIDASYRWFCLGLVLSIPNWDQEAANSDLPVKQDGENI
jgi:hypothetical protein